MMSVRLRVVAISVPPSVNAHPLLTHNGHFDPVVLAVNFMVLKRGVGNSLGCAIQVRGRR